MPRHKQRRSTRTIKLDDPNVSYRIETDRGVITVYPTSQGPSLDIYVDHNQHKANETFLQIWRRDTGKGEGGHVGHVCGVDDRGIQVRLRAHGSLSYGEVRDNPGLRPFYNRAIGKPDDFMLDSEKQQPAVFHGFALPVIVDKAVRPIGICHFWIPNVRITKQLGGHPGNVGQVGDLRVIETSVDREIIKALFYPIGAPGFGEVMWPQYELVDDQTVASERAAYVGHMEDRTGDSPHGDEPKAIKAARMVESMLYATTTAEGKSLYAQAKAVLAAWEKQQQEGGAA